MKTIFTILLLLISSCIFSQIKFDYLKLENSQVIFERVFNLDSLKSSDIEKLLISNVSKVKDFRDFRKDGGIITGKIENAMIDIQKCGFKRMTAPVFLNGSFFCNVSIVWKDEKYKVTISNILFSVPKWAEFTGTEIFAKKRGTEMKEQNDKLIDSGKCLENYLSELFAFSKGKNDW